jgi:hypothetical protein
MRWVIPAAMAAAFAALMGVASATKADVPIGEPVAVRFVCAEKGVIEAQLDLLVADPSYQRALEHLKVQVEVGQCLVFPGAMPLTIQEVGRSVRIIDTDGDEVELTAIRVTATTWSVVGRVLRRGRGA